jgi:hypothetical protein
LPPSYFLFVGAVVPTYLVLVEWVKGKVMRRLDAGIGGVGTTRSAMG